MIEREYQVMKALGTAGVPVPECLALCEDESVCGTPFYIMRYIHGRVFKNAALNEVPKDQLEKEQCSPDSIDRRLSVPVIRTPYLRFCRI